MMYRSRGVVRHGAYVGIVEVVDLAASRRAGECVYRELYQYPHVWQSHESAAILNGAYLATQRECDRVLTTHTHPA